MTMILPATNPCKVITREMALEAARAYTEPPRGGWVRVLRDILNRQGWEFRQIDRVVAREAILPVMDELFGVDYYVLRDGRLRRHGYTTRQGGDNMRVRYSPRSRMVLVVAGRIEPFPMAAARFLRLFPEREALVARLLDLMLRLRSPADNTAGYRACLIGF